MATVNNSNLKRRDSMLLIFSVPNGTRKRFFSNSGTQKKISKSAGINHFLCSTLRALLYVTEFRTACFSPVRNRYCVNRVCKSCLGIRKSKPLHALHNHHFNYLLLTRLSDVWFRYLRVELYVKSATKMAWICLEFHNKQKITISGFCVLKIMPLYVQRYSKHWNVPIFFII